MRIIDTTQIVDPGTQQPLLGPSIDFLTQNQLETLAAIVQSMIGSGYSAAQVYVLYGCVVTGVTSGAGNFAMTAGAVFFDGEIYQVSAVSTTAVGSGNTVYSAILISNTGTDPYDNTRALDPVLFSDGSSKSVHKTRTWLPAVATTGSGTDPVSGWVYLPQQAVPIAVGSSGNPAYGSNFVAADGLYFYKKNSGEVVIFGDAEATSFVSNPGTLFTLPVGYRPAGTRQIGMAMAYYGSNTILYSPVQVSSAGVVSLSGVIQVGSGSNATTTWILSLSPFVAGA